MNLKEYNIYRKKQALDALIEKYPEMESFQEEVEQYLKKAGSIENRLAVIEIMLQAKLLELHQEILRLSKNSVHIS